MGPFWSPGWISRGSVTSEPPSDIMLDFGIHGNHAGIEYNFAKEVESPHIYPRYWIQHNNKLPKPKRDKSVEKKNELGKTATSQPSANLETFLIYHHYLLEWWVKKEQKKSTYLLPRWNWALVTRASNYIFLYHKLLKRFKMVTGQFWLALRIYLKLVIQHDKVIHLLCSDKSVITWVRSNMQRERTSEWVIE